MRQDAAEIYAWVNHAIGSQDRARINDRVATNLCSVTDYRAEFCQPGGDIAIGCHDSDFAMIELHVRENHASAEMGVVTKNGIAHIIKMRHLRFVEKNAIFEFARVSHHDAITDDHRSEEHTSELQSQSNIVC